MSIHATHINVSHNAFFSSHSEKNIQIEMWFIVDYTLIDNEYMSLLFSQIIFFLVSSACWASLQKLLKESLMRTNSLFA